MSVEFDAALGVAFGVFLGIPLLVLMFYMCTRCVVVEKSTEMIVERWGKYHRKLGAGCHCLRPCADRPRQLRWRFAETYTDLHGNMRVRVFQTVTTRVDMRDQVLDFPNQPVITRDNVEIQVHPMLVCRIEDSVRAVYEVYDMANCVEKLVQTTLRAVIGDMGLDDTLASREEINRIIMQKISHITLNWGFRILKVDILEIIPTNTIMDAMHKQLRAERGRRAQIISADGYRQQKKTESEGTCQSEIAVSRGDQQAQVLSAKGRSDAKVLIAQAEAEAVRIIGSALTDVGLSAPSYIIALKYIDALTMISTTASDRTILFPFESELVGALR